MDKTGSLSSQSSQSIQGDGKVHKSDVTALIKDWQLATAFDNQKSQVIHRCSF